MTMKNMNEAFPQKNESSISAEEVLVELNDRDRISRERLAGEFGDDKEYFSLLEDIKKYVQQAEDPRAEGYERARLNEVIDKLREKWRRTERAKEEKEFSALEAKKDAIVFGDKS